MVTRKIILNIFNAIRYTSVKRLIGSASHTDATFIRHRKQIPLLSSRFRTHIHLRDSPHKISHFVIAIALLGQFRGKYKVFSIFLFRHFVTGRFFNILVLNCLSEKIEFSERKA